MGLSEQYSAMSCANRSRNKSIAKLNKLRFTYILMKEACMNDRCKM